MKIGFEGQTEERTKISREKLQDSLFISINLKILNGDKGTILSVSLRINLIKRGE